MGEEHGVVHLDVIGMTAIGMLFAENRECSPIRWMIFIAGDALEAEHPFAAFIGFDNLSHQADRDGFGVGL